MERFLPLSPQLSQELTSIISGIIIIKDIIKPIFEILSRQNNILLQPLLIKNKAVVFLFRWYHMTKT